MIRKSTPSGYDPTGGHRLSLATSADAFARRSCSNKKPERGTVHPESSRSVAILPAQHPSRHRVELLQKFRIARVRCCDQRGIERAVRADRARLVLPRKILGQAHDQALRL